MHGNNISNNNININGINSNMIDVYRDQHKGTLQKGPKGFLKESVAFANKKGTLVFLFVFNDRILL